MASPSLQAFLALCCLSILLLPATARPLLKATTEDFLIADPEYFNDQGELSTDTAALRSRAASALAAPLFTESPVHPHDLPLLLADPEFFNEEPF